MSRLSFCFLLFFINISLAIGQSSNFEKGTIAESKKKTTDAHAFFIAATKQSLSLDEYAYVSHFFLRNYFYADVAIPVQQAFAKYKNKAKPLLLNLVEASIALEAVDSAQYYLNMYQSTVGVTNPKAEQLHKSISLLKHHNVDDTLQPTILSSRINTKYNETYPSLSLNDSLLIFTRTNKEGEDDFYYSVLDTCDGWLYAYDLGSPPNTIKHEQSHYVSHDGRYLFFTRCGNLPTNDYALGQCDIYFAYRLNDKWVEDVPFGATINTHAFEGMPSLSANQRVLYFVSDRPGGYGGKDIWVTVFDQGKWQVPYNLGPEINTPFDDIAPFIAPDGKTLYFSSNGHASFGGFDLYKFDLNTKVVTNLGRSVNSPFDEISPIVNQAQTELYFSSNRVGGIGGYDIYTFPMNTHIAHEFTTFWSGKVIDSISRDRLNYAYIDIMDEHDQLLYQYQSNAGDGSFSIPLLNNKNYKIQVYRSGYQDVGFSVTFNAQLASWHNDVVMLTDGYVDPEEEVPVVALQQVDVPRINFEKNVRNLTLSQTEQLRDFIKTYEPEKIHAIIINSYTDNSGTPAINQSYANERALSAFQIIAPLLNDERKVQFRIWGDADPIVPNDSDANRYLNRRLEIVIELLDRFWLE